MTMIDSDKIRRIVSIFGKRLPVAACVAARLENH